jgi:transcriptional regulator with XRE-family HTH domain
MRNDKLISFGQRVRELRKNRGLSQEAMAALAGVDRSYMGHIERGEKNITLTKIYQISDALGIDVADLFPRSQEES